MRRILFTAALLELVSNALRRLGCGHQVASTPPPAIAAPERGRGRGGNGGGGGAAAAAEPDSAVVEVRENTLWNRQLGVMSEEIVAALVCQIFEGARRPPPDTNTAPVR